MRIKGLLSICVALSVMLASCEKDDTAVGLPAPGKAVYDAVSMGEDYVDQLFYDFETSKVVHVSQINSWDLAFEAAADGYSIFMNGGVDVYVYNTHETDFAAVKTAPGPVSTDWMFDYPSGLRDSNYIGDWRNGSGGSKNEVYLIKLNNTTTDNNIKKIKLLSVTSTEYIMQYGDLNEKNAHTIVIPKDEQYNYSYFSFDGGGQIVQPDPPKDTWDIVFTRYRYVYREFDPDVPYTVVGALFNPYKTSGFVDTSVSFSEMRSDVLLKNEFSNHRDVIGFDWKTYDRDKSLYSMRSKNVYVIKNRLDHYWKLRFLGFYDKQGVKGNPSFEFERLQ